MYELMSSNNLWNQSYFIDGTYLDSHNISINDKTIKKPTMSIWPNLAKQLFFLVCLQHHFTVKKRVKKLSLPSVPSDPTQILVVRPGPCWRNRRRRSWCIRWHISATLIPCHFRFVDICNIYIHIFRNPQIDRNVKSHYSIVAVNGVFFFCWCLLCMLFFLWKMCYHGPFMVSTWFNRNLWRMGETTSLR